MQNKSKHQINTALEQSFNVSFVCPSGINCQRNDGQKEIYCEPLTQVSLSFLSSGKYEYPIIDGVPILLPIDVVEHSQVERETFYQEHYQERSRTLDLQSDYLRDERLALPSLIAKYQTKGVVLEIGCGTGIFADCSPNYIGMDYSRQCVFAVGFEQYQRFVASAESIPLPSESAGFIFSYNTLEHVPRPDIAFLEIDRLLAPGACVLLHPAWNCTVIQTNLIPVKPYRQLKFTDCIRKALLPLITNKVYKAVLRLPYRIFRLAKGFNAKRLNLKYKKLTPYLGNDVFIADCDACASIDIFDAIMFLKSRGYEIISHPRLIDQICSSHKPVFARKPLNLKPKH